MNSTKVSLVMLLIVFALVGSMVFSQDDADSDPLTIASVNPNELVAGQSANLTILGSGFDDTTTVEIDGMGELTRSINGSGSISASIPESISSGDYDLTLRRGEDSIATLSNAFSVADPPPMPVSVKRSEPNRMTAGTSITLSVFGSNFTSESIVRLKGYGVLSSSFVNSGILTATVPDTVAQGTYKVEVADANGTNAASPDKLQVVAPPAPTNEPPPSPTPIVIKQQPLLTISSFSANPGSINAGANVSLSFSVVNRGNETARNIIISLASDSTFTVAGGQSSISVPDMNPGTTYNGIIMVTAPANATTGATKIPLNLSYRDLSGEEYTNTADLSVNITAVSQASQIIIDAYTIEPNAVEPGKPVTIRMTIANTGNTLAQQVLVRISGSENILLPNGHGDAFALGDLPANQKTPMEVPFIVRSDAKNGPQSQPIVISYLQDGESKEANGSITINVASIDKPQPLILLTSYETGMDVLRPGSRFTLKIGLQNAGSADAITTMVTFGTVTTSGGDTGSDDASGGDSQTSSAPSTTFAPIGTDGVIYVGDIASGENADTQQEFIVSGDVNTGIYNLPITIRYLLPDGSAKQDSLNISLVVIVLPRLQIDVLSPLPDMMNVGDVASLGLQLTNTGKNDVNLISASVSGTNIEVLDGADIHLETLKTDEDTSINTNIMAQDEGALEVVVTISYLDGLNQEQTIVQTYRAEALLPPPPVDEPIDVPPEPTPVEPQADTLGEILLAFIGLGS